MHKHKVVQQSHGTRQVAIVLRDDYRRDEQVPHSITPSGDRAMCDTFSVLRDWVVCAVLVLPNERALISSVVTRLPPPPTASSGHPHSFFILPPAPPPHPQPGGTCPRHPPIVLGTSPSTRPLNTSQQYVRLSTTTTPHRSSRHRR